MIVVRALRQWLQLARAYESDLLLSPAVLVRLPDQYSPSVAAGGERPWQDRTNEHDFYGNGEPPNLAAGTRKTELIR